MEPVLNTTQDTRTIGTSQAETQSRRLSFNTGKTRPNIIFPEPRLRIQKEEFIHIFMGSDRNGLGWRKVTHKVIVSNITAFLLPALSVAKVKTKGYLRLLLLKTFNMIASSKAFIIFLTCYFSTTLIAKIRNLAF